MRGHFGWALASVVSAGLIGLGGAVAADLPLKARPMPVAVAAYNWTGCYVGGNIGGKWAREGDVVNIAAATGPGGPSPASSLDLGTATPSAFIGGGQVGCNWQSGHLVLGIEGDAEAQHYGRTTTLVGFPAVLFVPGDTFDLRSDWQASVRGRIGYAWDRTLLYVTGGVAFTDLRATTTWVPGVFGGFAFPGTITSQTKDLVGGTVGAGVEQAITDNFTVGVEGRYTWYGNQTFDGGQLATSTIRGVLFTFAPTSRDVRLETAEVLLKANWKFNSGPVVAKY
jgi:outer membrane immunogenic protein